jgi:hypothetical protein
MPQQNRIGSHKTSIYTDGEGFTNIIYHNTAVVRYNEEKIILDSGGYYTNTTKTRMNQAANQFRLGFEVYQKNFDWFVKFAGKILPFGDKLTLQRRIPLELNKTI